MCELNAYRVPPQACPNCGARLSGAATSGEDRSPQAGDLTVCIKCVTVLVFDEDMHVRRAAEEEMEALCEEEKRDLREVCNRVRRYKHLRS